MNEDWYFFLSVFANVCQIQSYQMNNNSLQNEDLLKYLQHQDSDYLIKIIEQNEKIIYQNNEILRHFNEKNDKK